MAATPALCLLMNLPVWINEPALATGHVVSAWLFLRLLGLVYFAAFISLGVQICGLIGRRGILPAGKFLAAHRNWGNWRFVRLPTLCWFNASDGALLFLCWGGAAMAIPVVIGVAPWPMLLLLWLVYLSLFTAGQIFLRYQWDLLLLEAGFLAIFLAPAELAPQFTPSTVPPRVVLALFWWLLFRLMFLSGVVKWRHGDPSWRKFTALAHHFETQPLPTRLAWWAHRLPVGILKFATATMLVIELIFPWLIFASGPWRHAAAVAFVFLLVLIQLTGNYGFFQLLSLALCVLLLDDHVLTPAVSWLFGWTALPSPTFTAPAASWWISGSLAILVGVLSLEKVVAAFWHRARWPHLLARFFDLLEPFRLVNHYGLFAVMTRSRPEIIIEGTEDGVNWQEYGFRWKPGDAQRAPGFIAPHLPRLDWQMWFAAQEPASREAWFDCLLTRLAAGSPPVLALLRHNPFPHSPPRQLRAVLQDYLFTESIERRVSGNWWKRGRRTRLTSPSGLNRAAKTGPKKINPANRRRYGRG